MFCKNCGNQIRPEAKFCPFCGADIKSVSEENHFDEDHKPTQTASITNSNKKATPIEIVSVVFSLLVILALIAGAMIYWHSTKLSVEQVKEGYLTNYDLDDGKWNDAFSDATVGKVFDDYFYDTNWTYEKGVHVPNGGSDEYVDCVRFTGKFDDLQGNVVDIKVDFEAYSTVDVLRTEIKRSDFTILNLHLESEVYAPDTEQGYHEYTSNFCRRLDDEKIFMFVRAIYHGRAPKWEWNTCDGSSMILSWLQNGNETSSEKTQPQTTKASTTETTAKETTTTTVTKATRKQVPQMKNLSLSEATSLLSKLEIDVHLEHAYSDEVPVDYVISQSVPAGKKAEEVPEITLVISLGTNPNQSKQEVSFTQDQLASIRNELGVPSDFNVDMEFGELYYWDAVGLWLVPVNVIYDGDVIASADVYADSGEVAKNVCMYASESGNPVEPVNDWKGQINVHGGIVAGYTTDYIVYNGAYDTVRKSLGDRWHVTAKNTCFSNGITWYELWDSDDGDYYGWVDEDYIDFY